ncbi:MAG: hypothetical protein QM589_14285 [Thermomicrobiales bacterium]
MPNVEYIAEHDAPPPPRAISKGAAETLRIIHGIKDGQVAKVTPDGGQTLRGLKASFTRVARGQGIKIQTWTVLDNPSLYVKKVK